MEPGNAQLSMTVLMTPDMANFSGNVHGGTLLKYLDEVAYACASRYAGRYVVTLSVAQVIDPSAVDGGGKVVFGATVELEDEDSGDTVKYQIVGEDEAALKRGLINISSPIARALIGKEEGDTAEVQAPGGIRRYEVVGVSYL